MKRNLIQFVIALDQALNTLTPEGWADETLSAHAWRSRHIRGWGVVLIVADWIFGAGHCKNSYDAELDRLQSPPSMRIIE